MTVRQSDKDERAAPQLQVCPKCKERALYVQGMSGEDDHGQIEGEQEYCENCGHEDQWASRC